MVINGYWLLMIINDYWWWWRWRWWWWWWWWCWMMLMLFLLLFMPGAYGFSPCGGTKSSGSRQGHRGWRPTFCCHFASRALVPSRRQSIRSTGTVQERCGLDQYILRASFSRLHAESSCSGVCLRFILPPHQGVLVHCSCKGAFKYVISHKYSFMSGIPVWCGPSVQCAQVQHISMSLGKAAGSPRGKNSPQYIT